MSRTVPMLETSVSQEPTREADAIFRQLRELEFPWTAETTYLNHASIGPIPERTRQTVDAFNAKRTAPYLLPDRDLAIILGEARQAVARLVNAEPEEIGLATNTSYGLNMAARSLPLREGDIVLLSDREFPANVYPWLRLRDRGVRVEMTPVTEAGWPDEARVLERLSDPRIKVLAVSLIQFANGYRVNLETLGTACRERGVFLVVDGIQAIGQVPTDLKKLPVDILACGGQKWLLSPWGSGFVYVRRELLRVLEPATTGWMAYEGTDDFTRLTEYNAELHDDGRRFENVTLPFQDFAGMVSSVNMLLELGVDRVQGRLRRLWASMVGAADKHGVPVVSPRDPAQSSAVVCLAPPKVAEAYHRLKCANVVCSMREGAIRLSPHCYNTVGEVERVVGIIADQGTNGTT